MSVPNGRPAITVMISETLLLPSIYEGKAIAKLSEAIRAPGPTGEGKTVGPGRAPGGARSAPAARAKKVARRAPSGARRTTFFALAAGALRAPPGARNPPGLLSSL